MAAPGLLSQWGLSLRPLGVHFIIIFKKYIYDFCIVAYHWLPMRGIKLSIVIIFNKTY